MNTKQVKDEYGRLVVVDLDSKKLYDYDNKARKITYGARIVKNGQATMFWAYFEERGTVDSIEERLETWNNTVKLAYALTVGDAGKNDPDGAIYKKLVERVKENASDYFTKDGNFRKRCTVTLKDIQGLINNR